MFLHNLDRLNWAADLGLNERASTEKCKWARNAGRHFGTSAPTAGTITYVGPDGFAYASNKDKCGPHKYGPVPKEPGRGIGTGLKLKPISLALPGCLRDRRHRGTGRLIRCSVASSRSPSIARVPLQRNDLTRSRPTTRQVVDGNEFVTDGGVNRGAWEFPQSTPR